jgi:hypothetical protein
MYSQPTLQRRSTPTLSTWGSAWTKYPWNPFKAIPELFKNKAQVEEEATDWLAKLKEASGVSPDAQKPQGKKFPTVPVVIVGASVAALYLYYRREHKKGKTFLQAVMPFIDLKKA